MVDLLLVGDEDATQPGVPFIRTVYDPAAGTGGMLSMRPVPNWVASSLP